VKLEFFPILERSWPRLTSMVQFAGKVLKRNIVYHVAKLY